VLKFLDFTNLFEVHTNASDFAIRAIFMQCGHPNAFENKKLYGAQLRWVAHEKELYVVMCCFKTWQHHLGTHKTKVFMDNISLKYFKLNQGPLQNI
jgi:hypothetical protein